MSVEAPSISSIGSIGAGIEAGPAMPASPSMGSFEASPIAPMSISSIETNGGMNIPAANADIFSMPHFEPTSASRPDNIESNLNLGEFATIWEAPKPTISSKPIASFDIPKPMVGQSLNDIYATTSPLGLEEIPLNETQPPGINILENTKPIWQRPENTSFISSNVEVVKPDTQRAHEILKTISPDLAQADKVIGIASEVSDQTLMSVRNEIEKHIAKNIVQPETQMEMKSNKPDTLIETAQQERIPGDEALEPKKNNTPSLPINERDTKADAKRLDYLEVALDQTTNEASPVNGEKIYGVKIDEKLPDSLKHPEVKSELVEKVEDHKDGSYLAIREKFKNMAFETVEQARKTFEKLVEKFPAVRSVFHKTTEGVTKEDVERVLTEPDKILGKLPNALLHTLA